MDEQISVTMGLSDQDFRAVVAEDARRTTDVRMVLRSTLVLRRWHDCLADLLSDLEVQFASKEASFEDAQLALNEFRLECLVADDGRSRYLSAKNDFERNTLAPYRHWRANAARFKMSIERALRESRSLLGHRDTILMRALIFIGRMDDVGQATTVANQAITEANKVSEVNR